jgi:nitroreductase
LDLAETISRRHMVRSFSEAPVDPEVLQQALDGALHSPTAGHTRGVAWLVLEESLDRAAYWEATTDQPWRERSSRWLGLSRAPVIALSLTSPDSYLARYAEPDKSGSGLDLDQSQWPIPYWFGDAAFSTYALLLGATSAGLGASFLGNFRGERELLDEFGVPIGWRLFGSVLIGHPDGLDHRSKSVERPGPTPDQRLHRGRWLA